MQSLKKIHAWAQIQVPLSKPVHVLNEMFREYIFQSGDIMLNKPHKLRYFIMSNKPILLFKDLPLIAYNLFEPTHEISKHITKLTS